MVFEPVPLMIAFIFSLIPLLIGFKQKKHFLAILGCIATILISSAMHFIVSVLISLLFTFLIVKVVGDIGNTNTSNEH